MSRHKKIHLKRLGIPFLGTAMFLAFGIIVPAQAGINVDVDFRPPTLKELQGIAKENEVDEDSEQTGLPFDIREDALKDAALSFGVRGGLSMRTFEIRQELEKRGGYMDRVFNFRQLLISAPSGFLIEPPIVSESANAMIIQAGGQEAAVSDRIYNIVKNAKITSTPRTWRTYLEREWRSLEEPPDILRPEDEEEREIWEERVARGWGIGYEQANDIFEEDLNKLMADFQGMVRYRLLLTQGMISPPSAMQVDRGVTGGGREMRIGDRAVQITSVPKLVTGSDQWQPASR